MKLNVENLDERCLPSTATVVFNPVNGVLTITGDASDNGIYVTNFLVYNWDRVTGEENDVVIDITKVTKIICNTGDGANTYYNGTWVSDLVHGGSGNDSLFGGSGGGTLYGGGGTDWEDAGNVLTSQVAYYMDGEAGADLIQCCFGPDVVTFDPLDNVLYFNSAEDTFVYPHGAVTVIDNTNAGYSAPGWQFATGSGFTEYYNSDTGFSYGPNNAGPATWTANGLDSGTYRVSVTYTPYPNRATNASYSVLDGSNNLLASRVINQQQAATDLSYNGSQWDDLGTVTVATNGTIKVSLSGSGNGYLIADAVRLEKIA